MKRRQFLSISASSAGAIVLSQCAAVRPQSTRSLPAKTRQTRENSIVDVDLEAVSGVVDLGDRQANLFAYNGQIPGPTIEVQPGDTVRVRFANSLPEPTNLHYHGLHVSPTENADNVFLQIPSGETLTYEFTLPQNHPAGLFYYHPHHHGFVAQQIFKGLGGLLVVRGRLDEIPEIRAAAETFLVLKDFAIDADGNVTPPHHMERMLGREGALLTANGRVNPSLEIAPEGLLRLRLLNASTSRFYRLAIENHPLYLIATDGGSLSAPVELSELLLSPGERADLLVRGDRSSGRYRLLNLPYNRGRMGMMGGGRMGRGMMGRGRMDVPNPTDEPQTLATLTYTGQSHPLALPETLIPIEALPEPEIVRRFVLNHGMAPGMGMVFLMNGKAFDPQRSDTAVRLNTVEEWELVNTGTMDHPFHLHTNPFQIISRNDRPEPHLAWKDTVLVPAGETVRIRMRFADFVGKTVYHCHILDHEDLGMMGIVEIQG